MGVAGADVAHLDFTLATEGTASAELPRENHRAAESSRWW